MNPHQTLGKGLIRRVRNWAVVNLSRARREHDRVMSDNRMAMEHGIQIARTIERGGRGCTFCR
jgi:hypothetical protein